MMECLSCLAPEKAFLVSRAAFPYQASVPTGTLHRLSSPFIAFHRLIVSSSHRLIASSSHRPRESNLPILFFPFNSATKMMPKAMATVTFKAVMPVCRAALSCSETTL